MTFCEVKKDFEKYVQKRHKKQGFITIDQDFNNHILPYFKDTDIKKLTKLDIVAWQNKILDKNFSNKYNAKIYYSFNVFMKYCISYSYLKYNIVQEVGPFPKKIEIKKHTTYNFFQFLRFKFYLRDFVVSNYFYFMYSYGPRPSETMALRFLDNKRNLIRIIHSLHRKGDRELDTPKNQSSIRCFKISLLWVFRIWLLKRYYIKKFGSFSNDYFIFGGPKPLAPTSIDRLKKEAYIKAKLPPITQHEFRHSYATRKIHHKVPIDKVSRSMGHSKVSTTLDIYLHQEKNTLNVFFD
ncbi:MAG: tyrosine-type recombinase/integrase [Bacilli bacterium]|jgi:integrase|nr:tyrosine-type recombinase/integrase [Bacilli bacterium]